MAGGVVVLITKATLGAVAEGDRAFGQQMLDTFLHALEGPGPKPEAICLYTEGVRCAAKGSPVELALKLMAAEGVRVVACRTCLERYGLLEQVAVGEVGTMKDIVGLLMAAHHVITV